MKPVSYTDITVYPLLARGKVRDIYEIDSETLLLVTTDRMSAFDVVMKQPVPYKGVILNQLTLFWMGRFEQLVPNHILESDARAFPEKLKPWRDMLEGRAVIARRAEPLPAECIARGYITGSGWKSYQATGEICGQKLPEGLLECQRLPAPLFTPSTKSVNGHDENISFYKLEALVGDATAQKAKLLTLDLYEQGSAYAREHGIIVADTKFEFGYINGVLHLIDEVLTPDSSRFWPEKGYQPGRPQPSFDKQYLRDWLNRQEWNHQPPPPILPEDVIAETEAKYREAFKLLTGKTLSDL